MAMIFNIFAITFNSKTVMLPIVLGLSKAAVCIILEVCFSSSCQCHMLKILHNVGPGFSLSQIF